MYLPWQKTWLHLAVSNLVFWRILGPCAVFGPSMEVVQDWKVMTNKAKKKLYRTEIYFETLLTFDYKIFILVIYIEIKIGTCHSTLTVSHQHCSRINFSSRQAMWPESKNPKTVKFLLQKATFIAPIFSLVWPLGQQWPRAGWAGNEIHLHVLGSLHLESFFMWAWLACHGFLFWIHFI